jgi:hypothetical protein
MKRILAIAFLFILSLFVIGLPVAAADPINPPDSITITSAKVVRNVIETGDIFVAVNYGINYPIDYPTDVLASESFYLFFYDTGGTIVGAAAPFAFIDNGYNANIVGFYFDAATAAGITWGAANQIGIVANPIYFASPPDTFYYTLSSTNYTTSTTLTANQTELQNYVRDSCKTLQNTYDDLILLVNTDVGTVLSTDGEYWLRNAMPGIASAAPNLFYIQYRVPQSEDMGYNSSLAATYAARYATWDINTGLDYLATKTGLDSAGTVAMFATIIITVVFIVFCGWKGFGIEPGLMGGVMILECGALLFGGTLLNIVLLGGLGGGILIFFVLYLRRA